MQSEPAGNALFRRLGGRRRHGSSPDACRRALHRSRVRGAQKGSPDKNTKCYERTRQLIENKRYSFWKLPEAVNLLITHSL